MLPFWLIVVIWPSKHAGLIYDNLLAPWDEKGATFAPLVFHGCFGAQLAEDVKDVLEGNPLNKMHTFAVGSTCQTIDQFHVHALSEILTLEVGSAHSAVDGLFCPKIATLRSR